MAKRTVWSSAHFFSSDKRKLRFLLRVFFLANELRKTQNTCLKSGFHPSLPIVFNGKALAPYIR